MKSFLFIVSLVIALPAFAQEVNAKLIVDKIDLAPIKEKLHLKDREKFSVNIYQYNFDVPDVSKRNLGFFEVHGKNPKDADKLIVGCHRFGPDGNGQKQEDPNTICGKIYEASLSVFVDRPRELTTYLMDKAKRMGKEYSTSKTQIQDFVFLYGNDGILVIRRASRISP